MIFSKGSIGITMQNPFNAIAMPFKYYKQTMFITATAWDSRILFRNLRLYPFQSYGLPAQAVAASGQDGQNDFFR